MKIHSLTSLLTLFVVVESTEPPKPESKVEISPLPPPPVNQTEGLNSTNTTGLEANNQPKYLDLLKAKFLQKGEQASDNPAVVNLMNQMAAMDHGIIIQAAELLTQKNISDSLSPSSPLVLLGYKTTVQAGLNDLYYLRVIFNSKFIFHVKIQLNGSRNSTTDKDFGQGAKLQKVLGPKTEDEEIKPMDFDTTADTVAPGPGIPSKLAPYDTPKDLQQLMDKFKGDKGGEGSANNHAVAFLMGYQTVGENGIKDQAVKRLRELDPDFSGTISLHEITLLGYKYTIQVGCHDLYFIRMIFDSKYIFHVTIELNDYNKSTDSSDYKKSSSGSDGKVTNVTDLTNFARKSKVVTVLGPKAESEEISVSKGADNCSGKSVTQ